MQELSARLLKSSTVYPTIRVSSHPDKLLMGVFDAEGRYVEGTVLDRRSGEQGAPMPRDLFPEVKDAEAPEGIYAGPLYFHFGHFLLESLARAWYAREHPDLPLVWSGAHTWTTAALRPWQAEILDLLGLRNPTVILAAPTRYEKLHVPDIGYRYDDRFHPQHAAFLGQYAGPMQVPGARLWLSRSRVGNQARDFSAEATEGRLTAAGWTVIHPESLSVREQLDHLSRAEVIAGEEGSAFHTLILLRDIASKRFEIFRRYGPEHGNMRTIGEARAVNQRFHTLANERVIHAEGRVVSKLNPNSSEILDVLEVPVPPPPSPDPREEVIREAVERLGPRRLLDVGSSAPTLVASTVTRRRVLVSRRFDFDPRAFVDTDSEFYELDLEQYAENFHPPKRRFDVIRIAATDFGEAMAAFRSSQDLAARKAATWLLGTGPVAARVALAIDLTQPGFAAQRLPIGGTTLFLVRRVPGEPMAEVEVARMSAEEIARRTRRLPRADARGWPVRLRSVAGRLRRVVLRP